MRLLKSKIKLFLKNLIVSIQKAQSNQTAFFVRAEKVLALLKCNAP